MINKLAKTFVYIIILLLVISLTACGGKKSGQQEPAKETSQAKTAAPEKPPEKAPEKPKKDSVIIAISEEPSMLDPQKTEDGNMRLVTESVFDGLMAMDGQSLKPSPALASDYKRTDDRNWVINLRKGVKFHNGNPFNADDVVFSVERQLDPELKSEIVGFFASIEKIKKLDDYSVQVTTKGPDPILPTRLTLLKILDQEYAKANKDKLVSEPVGTGPYKVTKWQRGGSIEVEAFPDYWGQKPKVNKLVYRFIKEDATRAAAVQTEEIDLAVNMLPEYIQKLPKVETIEGLEFAMLRLTATKGSLQDKRIRQAIALSIDKEALVKGLYGGYARVAPGQYLKAGYFGFNPNLKPFPFDQAKARQLLKEANYKGEPIQIVFGAGRWLKDRELWETVASMMQQVGFKVDLKALAFQEWLNVHFAKGEKAPHISAFFNSNDIFDADRPFSSNIHSSGTSAVYSNKLDSRIEALRTELDLDKRQKGYEELLSIIYDDVATVPLFVVDDIFGMGKNISYKPRQDSRLATWTIEITQ